MDEFFSSGRAVDLVLLFIAAEAAVLIFIRGRNKAVTVIIALMPGVCLLLAARAALTDSGWMLVGLWLAASLPFHLMDLKLRLDLKRGPPK